MAVLDHMIAGTFVSDGNAKTIVLPCDVDAMEVINFTNFDQTAGEGIKFEWQRGMAADTGIEYTRGAANAVFALPLTSGGFTLVDSSNQALGAAVAITDISNATPPVVLTGTTSGLTNGDVVRIYNAVDGTTSFPYNGYDFTIGNISAGVSFELSYMVAAGHAADATYRRVPYDPIYYPRRRFITSISKASQAVIVMSVTHGYTVGQRVRLIVPAKFGMVEMNNLAARIVAINTTTNSITVDVDSSAFTTFAFPTAAVGLTYTPAQVVPFGDAPETLANVNADQSVLDGATRNTAYRGMRLAGGANAPGGSSMDVIYWKAWKAEQYQTS